MDTVISADGTSIACYRRGTGPPLILVPGTGAANPLAWTAVIPTLAEHFSVCAMDRRGHGRSGDAPIYALEREFEDIAAVVDSMREPANLLGHSFGALCALEAALLTPNIQKLILYEPAIPFPGAPIYPEGVIDRLQALLDAGDSESLLITFYREVAMLGPDEIEQLRSGPAWTERVSTAHALPREARAEEGYTFDAQRFKDLETPALFLLGSESPAYLKASTETVEKALPMSRIEVMPGQQHIAMYAAPDLFLQKIVQYLKKSR
jgi:pimeloyl-ACP methyl ester carboxylesterase